MQSLVQCYLRISKLRRILKDSFESAMYTQQSTRPSDAFVNELLYSRDSNSTGSSFLAARKVGVANALSDHQLGAHCLKYRLSGVQGAATHFCLRVCPNSHDRIEINTSRAVFDSSFPRGRRTFRPAQCLLQQRAPRSSARVGSAHSELLLGIKVQHSQFRVSAS